MFLLKGVLTAPRYLGPVPHDASYYAKCMLGGVLACGITHAGMTPLDVTKCNMQVRPHRVSDVSRVFTLSLVGKPWQVHGSQSRLQDYRR